MLMASTPLTELLHYSCKTPSVRPCRCFIRATIEVTSFDSRLALPVQWLTIIWVDNGCFSTKGTLSCCWACGCSVWRAGGRAQTTWRKCSGFAQKTLFNLQTAAGKHKGSRQWTSSISSFIQETRAELKGVFTKRLWNEHHDKFLDVAGLKTERWRDALLFFLHTSFFN